MDGNDFIQKLQYHCLQGDSLLPLTKLVTFQVHHLHTRVSHADILTAVNHLLTHPLAENRYQRLNSEAIEMLTSLFLENNVFSYNEKIYRHVKGSPINLSFTELLFNIYLHDWQIPLVREIRLANEFYGRFHNTGFLTWYGSMEKLQTCFSDLNVQHPDIQITISIGSHVHFLNAYIENRKGDLYTRVYHDPSKQPFLLPYVTGHPRLVHRQWFRFALLRASQYCSSWDDFNEERIYIELTFLANGYSVAFVEDYSRQFFERFHPIDTRATLNRWTYPAFRKRLGHYLDEQKAQLKEQEQLDKNHQLIELHYLFDWGLRCVFNEIFDKSWRTMITKDPYFQKFGLKIKLNSKHCYSSNTLFLQ